MKVDMDADFILAKQLFEQNEIKRSLAVLNECISVNVCDYQSFLLRGRIFYKMQKWGNAMNDYSSVLELDPDNQEAKTGLELTRNILGYFNPDMFNP
ncbi:MAG: tetratricopeptide repeat protein [Prolixibacteraceae bacterium]